MAITDAKTALATAQAGLTGASTDAEKLAANRAIQAAASNLITVLSENGGTAADRGSAVDALNNAATEIGRLERALAAAEKGNAAAIAKLLKSLDPQTANARSRFTPPGGNPGRDPGGDVVTGQGPGPATAPDFDAVYGGTTTVTVKATGTDANPKLKGAVGTMVAGKNRWSGTMVTATDPATKNTDTVLVYTNIEAPKSVAFSKVFGNGNLTIGTTGDSNIQASGFSTGHAAFTHGTNDATDVNEVIRISGTYAGAPGVYSCAETAANTCTSQGTISGIQLGGPWIFEPSPGAMAIQKDTNYSYFGWWLRVDGNGDYSPSNFFGHNTGLTLASQPDFLGSLTGLATYSGPAVGKFAIAGFPNTGGHFTADASLSVDFGNSTDRGTVEGAVTNFMVGGAEMPWRVDFANANVGVSGEFAGNATWTIGGVASATGTLNEGLWDGVFQRNNVNTDLLPKTATGGWEVPYVAANNGRAFGHMIGAFGVTKDD